jgi:hypothetical protein
MEKADQGNLLRSYGPVKAKVGSLPQVHRLMVWSLLRGIHLQKKKGIKWWTKKQSDLDIWWQSVLIWVIIWCSLNDNFLGHLACFSTGNMIWRSQTLVDHMPYSPVTLDWDIKGNLDGIGAWVPKLESGVDNMYCIDWPLWLVEDASLAAWCRRNKWVQMEWYYRNFNEGYSGTYIVNKVWRL